MPETRRELHQNLHRSECVLVIFLASVEVHFFVQLKLPYVGSLSIIKAHGVCVRECGRKGSLCVRIRLNAHKCKLMIVRSVKLTKALAVSGTPNS